MTAENKAENKIAATAQIHPKVKLGRNTIIEDFCKIGFPPANSDEVTLETTIGDGSIIRSHTVIYSGNKIGKNFQTGNKANIRENNVLGDNVSIGTMSVVEHHVSIGSNVRVHTQVFIPEHTVLEDGAWIGPQAVLTNAKYPNNAKTKKNLKGIHVERGAIIGANVTILPGVKIGERAIIGAGAVVTSDVEKEAVMAGNPAVKIKTVRELPDYDSSR